MATVIHSIHILQITIFIIIIVLASFYSLSIFLLHRMHWCHNIFTINLCFAAICSCSYWLSFYVILDFYPKCFLMNNVCLIMNYFEMMCTLQVPLAVIVVSIHRLCCVIYHTKAFFRRKRWAIICITIQWLTGISFSLPYFLSNNLPCSRCLGMKIYQLIITVILPSLICLIINLIIFKYVRASTNRVQPISQITGDESNNHRWQRITRRDMHLLRHIIVMFCIFMGGWSPIFIITIAQPKLSFTSLTISLLILLAELTLLIDIVNLYVYNHELRRCLKREIFKWQ